MLVKNNGAARGGRSFVHFVAIYLKASTLAVSSQMYILIPWTCFNGVFVIAISPSQEQIRSCYESWHWVNHGCVEKRSVWLCLLFAEKGGLNSLSLFTFIAIFAQEANSSKVNDSVSFPGNKFAERAQYYKSNLTDSPAVQ